VERELSFAGYQTVRFRQPTGGSLYAVFVERVPGVAEAEALVGVLREQGFTDAVVQVVAGTLRVRVGEPMALRGAVELATRLRARGHAVRVAVQPGQAETFVVRHGHFASRDEAEARSEELMQLGLPNHVVRVR
jgi:cell division septation protein DedD